MEITEKLGFTVTLDPDAEGYYVVSAYVLRRPGGFAAPAFFPHLSWTEAVDVMLAIFNENRPGFTDNGPGSQLALW